MRLRDNSLLELQTAETGVITITSENIDKNIIYTISEYGACWSFCSDLLEECINYLEQGEKCISINAPQERNYKSWWLFTNVFYVDRDIEKILIDRIYTYISDGSLEIAYLKRYEINSEYYSINFVNWLSKAGILINSEVLIPKNRKSLKFVRNLSIEIYFEGFNLPIWTRFTTIQKDKNLILQDLLDTIYSYIKGEVEPYTYGKSWVLIDLISYSYLPKQNNENKFIKEIVYDENPKYICKKINFLK